MDLTNEQALQQAVEAHKAGKLQEAEALYRAILQTQPKHPDANHNLGVLAVSLNKSELAVPLFKTALEANPNQGQFWISYVDALIKEKQFDNARSVLEQGKKLGLAGESVEALEMQLTPIAVVEKSKSILQKQPSSFTQQRKRVSAKKEKKKNSPSNQTNPNQVRSPSQVEVNALLEHYQKGRYDLAENLAKTIAQKYPDHQFSWKVLGVVFQLTGRLQESLIASQRSVAILPNDAEAHSNLGNTLKELGRLEEAEASYSKAIALKPDLAEAHFNLGNTLKELGRLEEAEASYSKAIAIKPDLAEAHFKLGNTLKELGRLEEVEASFRKAIAIKPEYAQAHSNLGNTLQELGRLEEAEASYSKAIAIKPDLAEAHSNLGATLQELGRLEEAEASCRKAIALKPELAEAYSNLGATLQELGRLEEAEASCRKAIAIKPEYAEAHSNLGNTLKELGRLEEAEVSCRKAIAIKPDYAQAHNNLGITLKELGRLEDAEASYKKAIEINPEYAKAHSNLGAALKQLGRLADAEASYKKAIDVKPEDEEKWSHLIAAMRGLNPVRATDTYVSSLFDGYAKKFESSLVGELNYKTPTIISSFLRPLISSSNTRFDILDLGCGTGLAGEALIDLAKTLVGIDLSKEMLKLAKAKNIYTRLIQDEIHHALCQEPIASFDMVVSSDVFVYVGDLGAIFDGVYDALKVDGFFAYSTEALFPANNEKEEALPNYKLNATGRYSHSSKYLLGLIDPKRFILHTLEIAQIRLEKGQPIMGYVVIMQKLN
jgi:predicted TPR repeat methyltransferase